MQEMVFSSIGVSPGVAIGKVRILASAAHSFTPEMRTVEPDMAPSELRRLKQALEATRLELDELQRRLIAKLNTSEAGIFDAHIMMLEDPAMIREAESNISEKHLAAESAYAKVLERCIATFAAIDDPYIKERIADVRDVGSRVLAHLQESGLPTAVQSGETPCIVLARDLTPSDTVRLDRKQVLAFVTETGSRSSHSAILARSMQIPALVRIPAEVFEYVTDGDTAIVDGGAGKLIIHPSRETYDLYIAKFREEKRLFEELEKSIRLRPETTDGFSIQLYANLENVGDLPLVSRFGACGIGLFRTEFMYMNTAQPPDEELQFRIYRKLLDECKLDPVVIRTLDVGGDKFADSILTLPETNPDLGLRGIRLGLFDRTDLLRAQLRALLRAAPYGNLKVMLPMVSDRSEVVAVREMAAEEAARMKSAGIDCAERLCIGTMIETPAAALGCDLLAREAAFFSIGSNDLVQYTLCVDRTNEKVAQMYKPTHPAVLKLLRECINVANEHCTELCICGEIAGDPVYTALLVGMGMRDLSMSPGAISMVRHVIRHISIREAEELAARVMQGDSADDNLELCKKFLKKTAPEVYSLITGTP